MQTAKPPCFWCCHQDQSKAAIFQYPFFNCVKILLTLLYFVCRLLATVKNFCGIRGFPYLVNGKTSQFMFPKYLMEYQNVKIVKSKFKSEKCNKKPRKSNVKTEKKRH